MPNEKKKPNWIVRLPGHPELFLEQAPEGWEIIGTVEKGYKSAGALLLHKEKGTYAMADKRELRFLNQDKIKKAIKEAKQSGEASAENAGKSKAKAKPGKESKGKNKGKDK